jgi:hypothetical protein
MAATWLRRGSARPPRATFVEEVIPRRGVGAELGVQRGDFSQKLLELAAPRRLHLVDLWYQLGAEWHWGEGEARSAIAALVRVIGRFANELVGGRVVLEIGDDLDVLTGFEDDYLDWAYVDTSHDYEHTMRELELLQAKVKPGGLIAGDDWLPEPEHPHHGVCRAVREFVDRHPYELIYAGEDDLQWAIRSRD